MLSEYDLLYECDVMCLNVMRLFGYVRLGHTKVQEREELSVRTANSRAGPMDASN